MHTHSKRFLFFLIFCYWHRERTGPILQRNIFILLIGRNDPFAKRVSVVGAAHELDILAEVVVRGPGTVPDEVRLEWNRDDSRFVAYNHQLKSGR